MARMPGHAICPYCKAIVQPMVGPDGQNLCPRCRNLGPAGVPAMPPGAQPSGQPYVQPYAPRPTVPGAVASLVLGIVGVVTGLLGLPCGIIAVVMANNAQRALQANPWQDGAGLITAGRVLGIIAIVIGALSLLYLLVVFSLVASLG